MLLFPGRQRDFQNRGDYFPGASAILKIDLLISKKKILAQFMEMSKEEKRKELRSQGREENEVSDYIKTYEDDIAALEKTIASPQTTEVMPRNDRTTLYRGRIIFLLSVILTFIKIQGWDCRSQPWQNMRSIKRHKTHSISPDSPPPPSQKRPPWASPFRQLIKIPNWSQCCL